MSEKIMRLILQLQETKGWSDSQLAEELKVDEADLAAMKNGGYAGFKAGVVAFVLLGLQANNEALLELVDYKLSEPVPLYEEQNRNFIEKLDLLKSKRQWSDAELAMQIGLADRQHLAKIRVGERPIPFEVKLRVWDLLGYAITRDFVFGLLPEKFASRIIEADNRRNRVQHSDQDDQEDR